MLHNLFPNILFINQHLLSLRQNSISIDKHIKGERPSCNRELSSAKVTNLPTIFEKGTLIKCLSLIMYD